MKDGFTPQQLSKMRDEYGKINTIDPSGQAYKQLIVMLDRLELDDLKTLAGAKIKFVSRLAQNRINRAKSTQKEEVDEACWDTHKQEGMKKKGDKMVPNCVPKNEASSPAQQAAIAIAMKKAGKKPKDMEEAVGGGTSVSTQSLKTAEGQKKRAEVAVKIAALKLKQQKERETLHKQKQSVKEEVMDVVEVEINEADKVPEYKTGGAPLAKKFEKAFVKMGLKTNIKMKTVNNISVNEAVMKKILKTNKKMKEQAPTKNDNMKSGEALSGKKEPIEINPEVSQTK